MRRVLHCGGSPDRRQPFDQALAGPVHLPPGDGAGDSRACPARAPGAARRGHPAVAVTAQPYPAQHHQAPGAGLAAGWHRSPRRVNRWQVEKRLRVGDPWRSRATWHAGATWRVITTGGGWARDYPGRAKREAPPPLLADLDCAVRGPGPVTPRLLWGSLVLSVHPSAGAHATGQGPTRPGPLAARPGRAAGCGRWNRRLARTRAADGQPRRGPGRRGTSMALSHLIASVFRVACGLPEPLCRRDG